MTTYWITETPCFNCGYFYGDEQAQESFFGRIKLELKTNPSVSFGSSGSQIGVVKILKKRTRSEKGEPYICEYSLKCYVCETEMSEEVYLDELKRLGLVEESWKGSISHLFWKRPRLRYEVESKSKGYKERWERQRKSILNK